MTEGEGMKLRLIGWWEQFGRRETQTIDAEFNEGRLVGTGTDRVGDFTLEGTYGEEGIRFIKRYCSPHAKHVVMYAGEYDGEGTYSGVYDLGVEIMNGTWLLKVERSATQVDETQNLPD